MNLDETIRLQALRLKQMNSGLGELSDTVIDQLAPEAVKQGKLKNICAAVSPELFTRVDELCSLLDVSKRLFVELALRNALLSAEKVIAEIQPFLEEQK